MPTRAVLWFRNDLRIRDNQLFQYEEVRRADELVAVYCIDQRHFEVSSFGDHKRIGRHRARFLAQSIEDLHLSLRKIGSGLLVTAGHPWDVIPSLIGCEGVLAFQREDTHEEQKVEKLVLAALQVDTVILSHSSQSLLHRDDLGWNPQTYLPLPFGKFFWGKFDQVQPRKELPSPNLGDLPPRPAIRSLRSAWTKLTDDKSQCWSPVSVNLNVIMAAMCCGQEQGDDVVSAAVLGEAPMSWVGGESSGLARLTEYAAVGLGTYHRTRNQLHGRENSSHLSAWLAIGCLSPRTVYWQAKQYEQLHDECEKDNRFQHVFKFVFVLAWREYFRYYCIHFGKEVFFRDGPAKRKRPWRRDAEIEARWRSGLTGVPLVDALMRELRSTGFMSNRGRYVVASYLVHYLGIDWRVGADWFETSLLDHDPCSNYGEWASMAMVAVSPTEKMPLGLKGRGPAKDKGFAGRAWNKNVEGDAAFDPWEQARQYDRSEDFVRHWVPELRSAPAGLSHWPLSADYGKYPKPMAIKPLEHEGSAVSAWNQHRNAGTFEKTLGPHEHHLKEATTQSKSPYGDGPEVPFAIARRWKCKSEKAAAYAFTDAWQGG